MLLLVFNVVSVRAFLFFVQKVATVWFLLPHEMGCCSPTDRLHTRRDVSYLNMCGWSSRCGLQLTYSTPPFRPVKGYLQWKRGRRRYWDRRVRSTRSLRVVMGASRLSGKKICTIRCRSVGRLSGYRLYGRVAWASTQGRSDLCDGRDLTGRGRGTRVGGNTFAHIHLCFTGFKQFIIPPVYSRRLLVGGDVN